MLPSLSLPPLECCFGTSPIQAEKFRPDRKAFGSATLATKAVAASDRRQIEPLARLIGSVPGHDLLIEIQNLCLQRPQLGSESEQTGACNLGQPSVACIGYHIEQLFNTITSDRCDNAKLCKMGTDRIDH